jgi:hypothetical protein
MDECTVFVAYPGDFLNWLNRAYLVVREHYCDKDRARTTRLGDIVRIDPSVFVNPDKSDLQPVALKPTTHLCDRRVFYTGTNDVITPVSVGLCNSSDS